MTDVVIHQHSRELLMMDILMSETCWAHKKWNKIASDIKLVFHSSTITMMHGPINIRFAWIVSFNVFFCHIDLTTRRVLPADGCLYSTALNCSIQCKNKKRRIGEPGSCADNVWVETLPLGIACRWLLVHAAYVASELRYRYIFYYC